MKGGEVWGAAIVVCGLTFLALFFTLMDWRTSIRVKDPPLYLGPESFSPPSFPPLPSIERSPLPPFPPPDPVVSDPPSFRVAGPFDSAGTPKVPAHMEQFQVSFFSVIFFCLQPHFQILFHREPPLVNWSQIDPTKFFRSLRSLAVSRSFIRCLSPFHISNWTACFSIYPGSPFHFLFHSDSSFWFIKTFSFLYGWANHLLVRWNWWLKFVIDVRFVFSLIRIRISVDFQSSSKTERLSEEVEVEWFPSIFFNSNHFSSFKGLHLPLIVFFLRRIFTLSSQSPHDPPVFSSLLWLSSISKRWSSILLILASFLHLQL